MAGLLSNNIRGMDNHRRADLQGLRAVAVLAVIGYHFGVPGVSGGFVGVDVFFVLSGFFITRVLMRDIEEHGRVRFARFWANRAKRLLPNGLLVICCVLAASALLLPAYRMVGISEDALSAAIFFANFHFAAHAVDYFHLDDPASPLLHYWSLAIEEHFYLVLPPAMMAVALFARNKARRMVVLLLITVAVVSFASSLVGILRSQPEAFFYSWYRAWQLACGGLTGLLFHRREMVPAALRSASALSGFIAIIASILMLDDAMTYPGIPALMPTLGTAALILGLDSGRHSAIIARFLAFPAMVAVGDISYSLYLWHWPVVTYLNELLPAVGSVGRVGGLVVTAALASAAYFVVERPVHHMKLRSYNAYKVILIGIAGAVLAATAAKGVTVLPSRTDVAVAARIAEASEDQGENYKNGCHLEYDIIDQKPCRFGHLGGPRVVLFGDSHAAQWYEPLIKAGDEAGWEVVVWTKSSCPAADVTIWYRPSRSIYEQCNEWRAQRLRALKDNPPKLVVLGNSTRYYGWIYDDKHERDADRLTSELLWKEGVERTANALVSVGIQVVEVRDTPRMYGSYKDCLSDGEWSTCRRPRKDALAGMASPEIASPLYSVLNLSDAICSLDFCPAVIGGAIAYHDNHHLTASFALTLYPHFAAFLSPTG